jgi:signal transduction histidine kinase
MRPRRPQGGVSVVRHRLQWRMAKLYALGFFALGVVLLAIPDSALLVLSSTQHKGAPGPPRLLVGAAQHAVDLHRLLLGSIGAVALLVPAALALGWLVAGRVLGPLRAITATARELSATALGRRIALDDDGDEVSELGATLDELFARLESSFEAHRRFVANASHELRTPLAGQKAVLQVALADPTADVHSLRAACEEAVRLADHQDRLIGALLTLATSERGVERWQDMDLSQIVRQVVGSLQGEAACRDLDVEVQDEPVVVSGDGRLVEVLVVNLVKNAVRHNVTGGRVEVSVRRDLGHAVLAVCNTGPVIRGADVEGLFEPFRRGGEARPKPSDGQGLGLAIVRAVATAHGAEIKASARPLGGLDTVVRFPRPSLSPPGTRATAQVT